MRDDDSDRGGKSSSGGGAVMVLGTILLVVGSFLAVVFFFLSVLDLNSVASLRGEIATGDQRVGREGNKDMKKFQEDEKKLNKDLASKNKEMNKLQGFDEETNKKRNSLQKEQEKIIKKLNDLREQHDEVTSSSDRQEKWDKDKTELEKILDDAQTGARKRRTWYILGMMFGFLITTAGGVCFLFSAATRVAGAILIFAVLSAVCSFSMIMMGAGGGGPPF